jgi:hypothetical protein
MSVTCPGLIFPARVSPHLSHLYFEELLGFSLQGVSACCIWNEPSCTSAQLNWLPKLRTPCYAVTNVDIMWTALVFPKMAARNVLPPARPVHSHREWSTTEIRCCLTGKYGAYSCIFSLNWQLPWRLDLQSNKGKRSKAATQEPKGENT